MAALTSDVREIHNFMISASSTIESLEKSIKNLSTQQVKESIENLKNLHKEIASNKSKIESLAGRVKLSEDLSQLERNVKNISDRLHRVLELPKGTHLWRMNEFLGGKEFAKLAGTSRAGRAFGSENSLKWKAFVEKEMGAEHLNQIVGRASSYGRTVDFMGLYRDCNGMRHLLGTIPVTIEVMGETFDTLYRSSLFDELMKIVCLEVGLPIARSGDFTLSGFSHSGSMHYPIRSFQLHKSYEEIQILEKLGLLRWNALKGLDGWSPTNASDFAQLKAKFEQLVKKNPDRRSIHKEIQDLVTLINDSLKSVS